MLMLTSVRAIVTVDAVVAATASSNIAMLLRTFMTSSDSNANPRRAFDARPVHDV